MERSKWLTRINVALLVLFVASGAFVLFYPVNPLTINSVTVEGEEFKAGGELTFKVDRCKSVDETTDGTATRYLVAQDREVDPFFLSSTDDLGAQGCRVSERKIILPAHIPDGEYKLCFVVKYYPSVLRQAVKKEFCSENSFQVKGLTVSAQLELILEQLKRIDPSAQQIEITKEPARNDTGDVSNAAPSAPVETPSTPQAPQQQQEAQAEEEEPSTIESLFQTVDNLIRKGLL